MTQPFTQHIWSGQYLTLHNVPVGGNNVIFNDAGPIPTCTLLRTLIWVHIAGYSIYGIGSGAGLNEPYGFILADLNSQNNNGNAPSDDPGQVYTEAIAADSGVLNYTALGFPPTSDGTLTGSINEISSSGNIHLDHNVNTFMYGNRTLFVDSHSQRIFSGTPAYQFQLLNFTTATSLATPVDVQVMIRMLYKQSR